MATPCFRPLTPRRLFAAGLLATLAVALLLRASSARAAETGEVDQARQALNRGGFPWYDKQSDAPRPVHVDVPWDLTPKSSKSTWRFSLFGISGWQWLALIALTATLAAIVWLLIRAYLDREGTAATVSSRQVRQAAVDDAARIEALPFRIRRGDIDLLAEARRLYEEGKYGEAMVYLFSYQLVEMDRHQVIRLAKGKTNRQYLRDLRRQPSLRQLVERSMVAFEEVFFGGHVLDRARFEGVWHQLGQFTSFLTQQGQA